jgi:hypothetical protein
MPDILLSGRIVASYFILQLGRHLTGGYLQTVRIAPITR